ncbi:MAG: phosphate acyltransferase [Fibrobacterota bacterium]
MIRTPDDILARAHGGPKTLIVTAAADPEVLEALQLASERKLVRPVLIGQPDAIRAAADKAGCSVADMEIVPAESPEASLDIGARMIAEGKGRILMKGLVNSALFLKVILKKEYGIRRQGLLSHVALFFPKGYDKPMLVTDAALNVFPTFADKISILRNAVEVMHQLGVACPKVALLAHNEMVSDKVPATQDCARLKEMCQSNDIQGCMAEGPIALDVALSAEAGRIKKITSPVSGDADILFCPDILSANILYKAMVFLGNAHGAAIVVGANVPIVMTSRSEDAHSKMLSIAFAAGIH